MKEYYDFLGLTENATDEELDARYKELKEKYSKDRFLEGEEGNLAAKNLTKLETAYAEIKSERPKKTDGDFGGFPEVERLIRDGKYNDAQAVLDDVINRDAEWHYLQSVVFYKKNWLNESKKQLEIATEMEPSNKKYKEALDKINLKTSTDARFHSGNSNYRENAVNSGNQQNDAQMGGDSCAACAECCATWCCVNAMCNICCRF